MRFLATIVVWAPLLAIAAPSPRTPRTANDVGASGAVASGAVASGAIASGAGVSGAVASGAVASGAIESGAIESGAVAAKPAVADRGAEVDLGIAGIAGAADRASAGVTVTFPLRGYYHPGRYMPVHLRAGAPPRTLTLADPHALATTLTPASGALDVIVPWLVYDAIDSTSPLATPAAATPAPPRSRPVESSPDPARLVAHPLEGAESLIAFTTEAPPPAGPRAILLRIDPDELIHSDPAAWQTLDELHVDPTTAARLGPETIARFRLNGATVWLGGSTRLDRRALPLVGRANPGAYDAVAGWNPDWATAVRLRVGLAAVALAVLVLWTTLWDMKRGRGHAVPTLGEATPRAGRFRFSSALNAFLGLGCSQKECSDQGRARAATSPFGSCAMWAVLMLCIAGGVAFGVWRSRMPAVFALRREVGEVAWRYYTARSDTTILHPFGAMSLPVWFGVPDAATGLQCFPDGRPSAMRFPLRAGHTLAVVSPNPER